MKATFIWLGLIFIQVPVNGRDEYITVLKVKFDKPVKLYRGRRWIKLISINIGGKSITIKSFK